MKCKLRKNSFRITICGQFIWIPLQHLSSVAARPLAAQLQRQSAGSVSPVITGRAVCLMLMHSHCNLMTNVSASNHAVYLMDRCSSNKLMWNDLGEVLTICWEKWTKSQRSPKQPPASYLVGRQRLYSEAGGFFSILFLLNNWLLVWVNYFNRSHRLSKGKKLIYALVKWNLNAKSVRLWFGSWIDFQIGRNLSDTKQT